MPLFYATSEHRVVYWFALDAEDYEDAQRQVTDPKTLAWHLSDADYDREEQLAYTIEEQP